MPGLVGACAKLNFTTQAIEPARFVGAWYEISHSTSFYWDRNCKCTTAEYFALPNGEFRVLNTCRKGAVDSPILQREATARQVAPGQLKVNFFHKTPLADADYRILWIDDSYDHAIIVSCSRLGGSLVWFLARQSTVGDSMKQWMRKYVERLGFVLDDFEDTLQSGCWSTEGKNSQIRNPITSYSTAVPSTCTLPTSLTSFPVNQLEARWHIVYTQPDFVENLFSHDCACNTVTLMKSAKVSADYPGSFQASVVCRKRVPSGERSAFVRPVYEISNLTSQLGHFTQKLYGGVSNEHWQILAYGEQDQVILSRPSTPFDSSRLEHMLLYTCLDTKVAGRTFCLHIISKKNRVSQQAVDKYIEYAKQLGVFRPKHWRIVLHSDECPYEPQPLDLAADGIATHHKAFMINQF